MSCPTHLVEHILCLSVCLSVCLSLSLSLSLSRPLYLDRFSVTYTVFLSNVIAMSTIVYLFSYLRLIMISSFLAFKSLPARMHMSKTKMTLSLSVIMSGCCLYYFTDYYNYYLFIPYELFTPILPGGLSWVRMTISFLTLSRTPLRILSILTIIWSVRSRFSVWFPIPPVSFSSL